MKSIRLTAMLLGLGLMVAGGCDDGAATTAEQPAAATAATPAVPLPDDLMVSTPPADAKAVVEVRKAAADGDEVVVRGRIAGREEPFTEGRAQFQLVDLGVRSCAEMPDESCPTPWDMCCEDQKHVADNSMTVQVVGEDGQPLKTGLNGVAGLKPLAEVSVKGKLKKSPDGKAFVVDATQVYVKQG